ncbi:MAG: helix-turn-helix domain-containing protein [Erythrobacter sp.]|nr:MAG: helix-turn-helix domain-containing protein [Erythrobacter sp.]
MTTRQVADLLGLSSEWLFQARKTRIGPPFIQLSRQTVRYERDDVLAWARKHRVETKEGAAA